MHAQVLEKPYGTPSMLSASRFMLGLESPENKSLSQSYYDIQLWSETASAMTTTTFIPCQWCVFHRRDTQPGLHNLYLSPLPQHVAAVRRGLLTETEERLARRDQRNRFPAAVFRGR